MQRHIKDENQYANETNYLKEGGNKLSIGTLLPVQQIPSQYLLQYCT